MNYCPVCGLQLPTNKCGYDDCAQSKVLRPVVAPGARWIEEDEEVPLPSETTREVWRDV